VEKGVDENGKRVLVFQKTFRPNSLEGSLIFLDECSMVGTKIGSELKSSGAKIIACGDHGQLQPIGEKQFFTKANFTLTEIHRQALESSIIRQAHYARETGNYKADGDDFRVTNQITPDNLREADIVLCWTNKTRHVFNEIIREIKGFTAKHPQAGESVMCLKNARDYGIYNGAIYTLARDMLLSDKHIYLNIDGNEFKIPNCYFAKAGETIDDYDNKKITSLFCYGYACTVNKGQGSEWDNVILVDEYSRSDQRKEWIYTAISRASKKILIQR
jgi:exodeoxyribonuclease-5